MFATAKQSARHAEDARQRSTTVLESALRHDRLIVFGGLALVCGVSWYWILAMSVDMYGSMRGASAWAMTPTWDWPHLVLLFAMWAVMMTAMMLPSAVPMLMLYTAVVRRSNLAAAARQTYSLASGYLVVWVLFSAAAAVIWSDRIASPLM